MYDFISTRSYVRVKSKKIYLDTTYYDLKKKMFDSNDYIEVRTSGLFRGGEKIIPKSQITDFGKIGVWAIIKGESYV